MPDTTYHFESLTDLHDDFIDSHREMYQLGEKAGRNLEYLEIHAEIILQRGGDVSYDTTQIPTEFTAKLAIYDAVRDYFEKFVQMDIIRENPFPDFVSIEDLDEDAAERRLQSCGY